MSIEWSSIDVIDPPMDKAIIIKKENGDVQIRVLESSQLSLEWAIEWMLSEGFIKWSDTNG